MHDWPRGFMQGMVYQAAGAVLWQVVGLPLGGLPFALAIAALVAAAHATFSRWERSDGPRHADRDGSGHGGAGGRRRDGDGGAAPRA